MAGIEDNLAMIGDWTTPNPSPRTLFSDFLAEDFSSRSFSDMMSANRNEGPLPEITKREIDLESDDKDGETVLGVSDDPFSDPKFYSVPKPGSRRGGLAERMLARAGFNAPKLNTARLRSDNLTSSPEIRSPYLTIPAGLSPTTLLDSPVFLSNSLAQPSPTTGKFPLGQSRNLRFFSISDASCKNKDQPFGDVNAEPFVFKPHMESSSSYYACGPNKVESTIDQPQSLPRIGVSVQPEDPIKAVSQDCATKHRENHFKPGISDTSDGRDTPGDFRLNQKASDSLVGSEQSPPPEDQQDGEGEPKGESSSVAVGTPSEDGYNWRKYGQKQVKGSEYPRSYYKCTHPNCQVKKKVERSHEGHITEIIYKGAHNHPKPPPNRRSAITLSQPFNNMLGDGSEHHGPQASLDGKQIWASPQNGTVGPDWKNDGMEATSSATVAAELFDPSTSMQTQDGPHFESADAIDVSSTLSNDDDEEDGVTHGSVSPDCDGEGDESESKRRKLETSAMDMSAASRALREPRVVVQTTSEVDILDDGYRWRKYGQKVVKGNPNPRSYYKCTNAGCTVRKHVERASHDLKSVITTYEGKHNHDVPAARNSSHGSSGPSGTASNSASHSHNIHKRMEPSHIQDSLPRFDGPVSIGTFGLSGRELGPQSGFSFGMGQPGLANLTMAGLEHVAPVKMLPPVHSYLRHRQVNENRFMIPKGEPKEEPMSEPGLLMSNGVSVYHQIMSRLPHL